MPVVDPLDEEVDLDIERRKWVLDTHGRLDRITYYELLGIAQDADKKAVKRAYFALAATAHPDRFFGKKLGSYRARIDAIFGKITEAYETLQSEEKRAAYDKRIGKVTVVAKPAAPDPRQVQKQKEALDALKQKLGEGRIKAQQHIKNAERAKSVGDFPAAAEAYRMALMFLPNDAELKRAHDEMQSEVRSRLGESHKKKALLEERHGHWAAAAESWKRALEAFPKDPEIEAHLANALARAQAR